MVSTCTATAWHDFTKASWDQMKTPVNLDEDSGAFPKEVHMRNYAKGAGRLFRKVQHVDALAIFQINPTLLRHLQYMARKKRMS